MASKRIALQLTMADYRAFRAAIGSMHPFKTPGQVLRALVNAYVAKHDGVGVAMSRSKKLRTEAVKNEFQRCRVCDQYKPAVDFSGTKFHTVCRACVTHSEITGNKRPGTPTNYLASQYHYRKIRREYMDRYAAGDPGLPSWAEYQKQQKHRKQENRREYFGKLAER